MLTDALRRAQRAVELDSAESDVPAAIAAYDDAITLLQRVIERRSKRPLCASEVERITDIVSFRPPLLLLLLLLTLPGMVWFVVSMIDMSSVYASSAIFIV